MTSTAVLTRGTSRWVPWDGPPRRADLLCWYALAGMAVFYTAMWPVRPILIGSNPVLLELLTGSKESIIAAGAFAGVGAVPLPVVVAAAMVGMMKFDAVVWWAGTLWGRGIVGRFARRSRVATWFAGKVDSVGPWVMWPAVAMAPWTPVPSSLIYAAAGWTGMRLRTFLVLDGIGTLVRASIYAGLGFAIGQPAVDLAETISANGLWVSVGIVVVMAGWRYARRLVTARRRRVRHDRSEATVDAPPGTRRAIPERSTRHDRSEMARNAPARAPSHTSDASIFVKRLRTRCCLWSSWLR